MDDSTKDGDPIPPERRIAPRVRIPLLVQYRYGPFDDLRTNYAIDVSSSGLFITLEEAPPPGTQVFVQLTTREGHLLRGEGRVVRTEEEGAAVELAGFDDQARAILEAVVAEALARQRFIP